MSRDEADIVARVIAEFEAKLTPLSPSRVQVSDRHRAMARAGIEALDRARLQEPERTASFPSRGRNIRTL